MALVGGAFSLVGHDGRIVTERSFPGRHVLIFFGFTHCRVVCPRALARISAALDLLGREADAVQPLYVTVDPERDTPDVMRTFLEAGHPRFYGLSGDRAATDAMKRAFRVFAERQEDADAPGGYVVPHTALTYLLGPDGSYRAHFPDTDDAATLAARLRSILRADGQATGDA